MNEELSEVKDGTNSEYATASAKHIDGETIRGDDVIETGRIYYPFVIGGKSGKYYLDHLPSGFSMRNYTWRTLRIAVNVIEQLRDVAGCEDENILDNNLNTIPNFAGVIRDNL